MTLGGFSVRNPVLINLLMILILIVGFFSLNRLPREQFAEVPFYFVNILVPFPGVSAEDIEQSVTVPVENEMSGMDKLDEIQSVTTDGLARITLQFDQGISNDEFRRLFQDVQNRFSTIALPAGTLQPSVSEFSTNDFLPVIEVVLSGEVPYAELSRTARTLRDELRGVREVSSVDLVGYRDRQVQIELNRDRMQTLGISLDEVVRAVQAQNVTVPGGTLRTDSREFLLRTVGRRETVEQFERIVIRGNGTTLLRDIANVRDGFDLDGTAARFNGEQAISLRVAKIPGGSSIGIVENIRDRMEVFQQTMPAGISVHYVSDSTIQIQDSLDVLLSNALFGLGLLVIILLIFIGVRNAIMTAVGIPLTFALTFIVLDMMGETLNGNTLFALVLVLGLVVDHAIVIVENSYRLQYQMGMSRHDAAIKGVNQVVVPVIAATLTTIAAFLPLTLLPGIIGRFLRVVPITVSIALIASTFEASVFLPSHYADWPGGGKKTRRGQRFERFQQQFNGILDVLYGRRGVVVLGALVVMILVFSRLGSIQQDLFSSEDASLYYVEIELPPGSPVERTDRVVRRFEERLLPLVGNGEVLAINSYVGFSGSGSENVRQANIAQLVVDLAEPRDGRTRTVTEIMDEAQQMTASIPGADVVRFRKQQGGPPTDPPVSFRIFGDSFTELRAVTEAFQAKLAEYPELFNIRSNLDEGTPEIRVRVDEDRAAGFGLSTQLVGQHIRGSFDGIRAGSIFVDNQESDVIIRFGAQGAVSVDALLQTRIPTPDGRQIPLSSVAVLEEGSSISAIRRIDGVREVTVAADAFTAAGVPGINAELRNLFEAELSAANPGVRLSVGGQFAEFANTLREILRVFVIGVFLIYLILATQFNSYTQPLLILITVPFAFVGVVLFLLVSGTPLSTTVLYAGVALAGIAVNDTIVLITFANEARREEGTAVGPAIRDAAVMRLRPILLTSLTTIAGLTPTALGLGGRSVVWGPMASTIIFGLLFSTVTTLVVVPSFYGLFYDRARRDERRARRRARKEQRGSGGTGAGGGGTEERERKYA
ncbi:MAG: efflux RND transporter permease subunit [Spirochaetaceae bacterium]|nr:MAG: efflux RND transporter permease subunit [Spirochaetaceae bacterium]